MMITKEKLKDHIDKFPEEEFTLDELIDRLVFIEKMEEKIKISQSSGSDISKEEEVKKWPR